MNILALQIKANTAEEMGKELEKVHDKFEEDILKLQGALAYLSKVEKDFIQITEKVKKDVLGEDPSVELNDPLEVAKYIVDKVMECSARVHQHMEKISISIPVTEGKKEGVKIAVKNLHNVYRSNKERVVEIEKMLTEGTLEVDGRGNISGDEEDNEENLTNNPCMFENEDEEEEIAEEESTEKLGG